MSAAPQYHQYPQTPQFPQQAPQFPQQQGGFTGGYSGGGAYAHAPPAGGYPQAPAAAYGAYPQAAYAGYPQAPPAVAFGGAPKAAAQPQVVVVVPPAAGGGGGGYGGGGYGVPNVAAPSKYVADCEQAVRMGFIRKVYAILGMQLFVTFGSEYTQRGPERPRAPPAPFCSRRRASPPRATRRAPVVRAGAPHRPRSPLPPTTHPSPPSTAVVLVFTFVDAVASYVQTHGAVLIAALVLNIGFLIALSCCPGVARTYPGNMLCLAGFTLAEGYLLGAVASASGGVAVAKAVACTVVLTAALTAYAWQTRVDYTAMGGALLAGLVSLMLFGLLCAIFQSELLSNLYAGAGALLFSFYLVYDTQLVIGGAHHSHKFEVDDYVFAALNIYIDIVQLFLYMLRLFGSRD